MNILSIGGTGFMGYFATEHALSRGHAVTLFNRGKTDRDAFPNVEKIIGDRDTAIDQLRGRHWDAVIDTSGYVPRIVGKAAELLADAVDRYLFISSVSVYADPLPPNADEDAALRTLSDPTTEVVDGETYGGLKVLCEQTVERIIPGRVLIIRPCVIVGPRDPTNRFDYWVERVAAGGEVLAPDSPDYPMQMIGARDLGEWLIRLLEARTTGIYNAVEPPYRFGDFLEACKTVSSSDAHFTWLSESFLEAQKVEAWSQLPLWAAEAGKTHNQMNGARAIAAGLTFRPLNDTIRETLEWVRANPAVVQKRRSTLSREREQALLTTWHADHL